MRSDVLSDWENESGSLTPTVKQARDLAARYGRSFLEWFLPERPIFQSRVQFLISGSSGGADPKDSRDLLDAQLWAETQRENALDLYPEIDEKIPEISRALFASVQDDVERVAAAAREAMEFPIEQQAGSVTAAQRAANPKLIRDKSNRLAY